MNRFLFSVSGRSQFYSAVLLAVVLAGSCLPQYRIMAQEVKSKVYDNSATIEAQFNFVIQNSSRWENYTMVNDGWMTTLRTNALDSLNAAKNEVSNKANLIAGRERTIDTLKSDLIATQESLAAALKEKNSFSVFGLNIAKGLFLGSVGLIILVLAGIAMVSMGLYKRSYSVIKKAGEELSKANEEMEEYRKESRKKLEQMVVQHHKEIQKLKG